MALFGKKQKNEIAPADVKGVSKAGDAADVSALLLRPRVTEKAAAGNESGVYTFDVRPDANAKTVALAVEKIFKVKPRKVNILPVPKKNVVSRGKRGVKSGGKKAYVYVRSGDKIEFV